ncbi:MAG: thymidylate synthase [Candidatus Aenigmatarchaeota archaeon]
MKHVNIKSFDIPDAWYKNLSEIWYNGDIFKVGYGSEETETKKLNVTIEITNPENPPLVHEKAPCDMKYVNEYALTYLYTDFIEDETYTYGSRLRMPFDQVETAMNRFVESLFDRQVTLLIRRPEDIKKQIKTDRKKQLETDKKHAPPCWTISDLEIMKENGELKLNSTGYFRSWDAYAGLPANIAGIQIFNESFVKELNMKGREYDKKWEDVSTGKMVFHSKNCHIYERQYKLVEELLSHKTQSHSERLANVNNKE